jgi:hypothetical protein
MGLLRLVLVPVVKSNLERSSGIRREGFVSRQDTHSRNKIRQSIFFSAVFLCAGDLSRNGACGLRAGQRIFDSRSGVEIRGRRGPNPM